VVNINSGGWVTSLNQNHSDHWHRSTHRHYVSRTAPELRNEHRCSTRSPCGKLNSNLCSFFIDKNTEKHYRIRIALRRHADAILNKITLSSTKELDGYCSAIASVARVRHSGPKHPHVNNMRWFGLTPIYYHAVIGMGDFRGLTEFPENRWYELCSRLLIDRHINGSGLDFDHLPYDDKRSLERHGSTYFGTPRSCSLRTWGNPSAL
jgi:hypothetical protein